MSRNRWAVSLFSLLPLATLTFAEEDSVHQPSLTPQASGTTQGLIAVSPVNARVAWASGRGGTFVVTTNGGHTWRAGVVPGAEALQFRDVQGVSAREAYLLSIGTGTDSRIYKTTDGGASWTTQFTNQDPDAFYDCFAFWTPRRGLAHSDPVNDRFPVLRTTNGQTWQDIGDNLPPALTGEFSFAASGTCVATQGGKNAWTINRLKDKLGSRSMATGEVTYSGALGYVVGELAAGFKQMMEMVNGSRLSNAMRAAGLMRRAVLESLVHARQRVAFGRPLAELPLLRSNLLSMLLDAEAAASVILNGAALLDRREAGAADARALARVWTPLAKYWITLRARHVAAEAMNVRGGNGYVEEWVNPRLLRDAYLGAIWEGSANVVALDVQRAIVKDRGLEAPAVFIADRLARVSEPAAKPWVDLVRAGLESLSRQTAAWAALPAAERELQARPVADALYHLVAGALLLAEGQALRERGQGYRKLLAAGLYLDRWLEPRGPASPLFTGRQIAWLDALADWRPVEAAALADVKG